MKIKKFNEQFSNTKKPYDSIGEGKWISVRISDDYLFEMIKNHHLAIDAQTGLFLLYSDVLLKSVKENLEKRASSNSAIWKRREAKTLELISILNELIHLFEKYQIVFIGLKAE